MATKSKIFSYQNIALLMYLSKLLKKARFTKILKTELFKDLPSRTDLFDQRLELKTQLSEPSLAALLKSVVPIEITQFMQCLFIMWSVFSLRNFLQRAMIAKKSSEPSGLVKHSSMVQFSVVIGKTIDCTPVLCLAACRGVARLGQLVQLHPSILKKV